MFDTEQYKDLLRDFGRTYFGVEVFHELYRFETK